MRGDHEGITDYAHDRNRTRELLREAGYEKGFDTPLWTMPVPSPYMPQPDKIAKAIRGNLAAVGIRARIVTYDGETCIEKPQTADMIYWPLA